MAVKNTGSNASRPTKQRNARRKRQGEGVPALPAAYANPASLPGVDAAVDEGVSESPQPKASGGGDRDTRAAAKGGRGLRDRAAALGEYGTALGQRGREGLSRAGSAVRSGASAVGHAAKDGFERGREITAEGWDSHPLVVCGAALVLGAVAGMLLPSTDVEDKMMGKAADRVNDRLRKAADGLVEQGRSVAGRTLSEATTATARKAKREGLTPERIGRKVKRLASHVRQAVVEAIDGK